MVGIGLIVAVAIFFWLKNKQENRVIDRHNRIAEKQEELVEMLKENNQEKQKDEN